MSKTKQLLENQIDTDDDKFVDDEYQQREFKLSPHEQVFSQFIESLFGYTQKRTKHEAGNL